MKCKFCNEAIPSTTLRCPRCGRMATKEQMAFLKDFNKNSGWDKYSTKDSYNYKKESAHDRKNILGVILVPLILIAVIVFILIKVIAG